MSDLLTRIENLSPARRKLLERMSARQTPQLRTYPLSYSQQRMWFIDQLEPMSPLYNMPFAKRVIGPLNKEALRRSLHDIVARHEILRTRFPQRNGVAVQEVMPVTEFTMRTIDLTMVPEQERVREAHRRVYEEGVRAFEWARGGLFEVILLEMAERDHVMMIRMHHIVGDGWSGSVFEDELRLLYAGYCAGTVPRLPELELQYGDFAVWQRGWLQSGPLQQQLEYWRKQLDGVAGLVLPTDYPRPLVLSHKAETVDAPLSEALTEELKEFCRRERVTLFMAVLAAFQLALSRYTGREDFTTGTPIANRNRVETEKLMGCFINTLVLRADLKGEPTFRELLARVRETTLAAYEHQDVPFEKLVEELQPAHDLGRTPLFQVLFVMENLPSGGSSLPGLAMSEFSVGVNIAKLELTASFSEKNGRFYSWLQFDVGLFDRLRIERLLGHFQSVLHLMVSDPEQRIWQSTSLSQAERSQVLVEWNRTSTPYPNDKCGHELVQAQVDRTPQSVALQYQDQQISYEELNRRANQLARYLMKLGVGQEVRAGICVERSLEMIVGLLGILKSGGTYVPLDPNYPAERLKFMVDDAKLKVLLVHDQSAVVAPSGAFRVVNLNREWERIAGEDDQNLPTRISPENLAYVIYTSGSTGKPKGVTVSHRALCNQLCWQVQALHLVETDRFLQKASFSFDASIGEILGPLVAGARIVAARAGGEHDIDYLAELIGEARITCIDLPPSLLGALLDSPKSAGWTSVRLVISGGEELKVDLVRSFHKKISATLVNTYGPTETTVQSAFADDPAEKNIIPIGAPIANTQFYVLDKRGQPVPAGAAGELHIGGDGLARGYLDRPELTAERFVPNPFSQSGGQRLYRTGDLVKWNIHGNLYFLGRVDRQVKLRGYRIELGEIESALRSHEKVDEAVVTVKGEDREQRLVGYVVKREGVDLLGVRELRRFLKDRLPEYMVPAAFVELHALPLTLTGKIDRSRLPEPEAGTTKDEIVRPRNVMEEILVSLWEGVLKQEGISIDVNFFEIGGHSLLAMRLLSRIRNAFGVDLPLRELFEAPTVAGMRERIELRHRQNGSTETPAILPIGRASRAQGLPLSYAQQRLWVIDQLMPGQATYNLPVAFRLEGELNREALRWSFQEIVRRHEVLRTRFPQRDGVPFQEIVGVEQWSMEEVDLSGGDEEGARGEEEVGKQVQAEVERPFDLEQGPLLRVKLLQVAEQKHVLLLNMHHIVSDGWSMGIMERELIALYNAYEAGQASLLAELGVQYGDYAVWQREWLQGGVLEEQVEYWRKSLEGLEALELPSDHPRSGVGSQAGASVGWELSQQVSARLKQLSRKEGTTLFMTLLAGFQLLLSRHSGQGDVAVGTPIAGRRWSETEELIGFFVNTLVLRTQIRGEESTRELLGRVREAVLGGHEHQDVPFEKLVEELRPARDLSRTPLFQVMFVMANVGASGEWKLAGIKSRGMDISSSSEKFDMTLAAEEHEGKIRGGLSYRSDVFAELSMRRLVKHFENLLGEMAGDGERPVGQLRMLEEEEREQVVYEWNRTNADYGREKSVQEMFEEQVGWRPEAVAVMYEEQELTYGELNRRANQLAWYLKGLGVGPKVRVGICVERSLEMIVGLMGILKAGGAYVPLDGNNPGERLGFMLADAEVAVVLTQERVQETTTLSCPRVICWEQEWAAIQQESCENPASCGDRENLAYLIYTSGSTGRPKAVGIRRGSVSALLHWAEEVYEEEDIAAVLASTSICFDLSVFEIFVPLSRGGRVVVVKNVLDWAEIAGRKTVTLVNTVPSAMAELVRLKALPRSVRVVNLAGEALSPMLVKQVYAQETVNKVFNLYGPSEDTTYSTWECLQRDELGAGVAIGRPIANTQAYVLGPGMEAVAVGVVGELHLGGEGLARGYLDRPELTAERFVPNPFSQSGGERLYRTGDMARWRRDGKLDYIGRGDDQVKLRGYRIELGEIEKVLGSHERVEQAVVMVREDQPGMKRLVGYVVKKAGVEVLLERELQTYLKQLMPEYMVPNAFAFLEQMPLTLNGKIDRKKLPMPGHERSGLENGYVAPATPIQRWLSALWGELLGLERVGIRDNFFELGGDSLMASRVLSRLACEYQTELRLRSFFAAPTVEAFAREMEGGNEQRTLSGRRLERVSREQFLPVSYAQRRIWLFAQLHPGDVCYNVAEAVRIRGPLEEGKLRRALVGLVRRHEILRTRFVPQQGEPRQQIDPAGEVWLRVIDLRGVEAGQRERQARELLEQEAKSSFDLEQGPLFRTLLLQVKAREYLFLVNAHHIVTDGWSQGVLWRDLEALYAADGEEPRGLPELGIQYADYAVWHREWLDEEQMQEQWSYWKRQLKGVAAILDLPLDRVRPE